MAAFFSSQQLKKMEHVFLLFSIFISYIIKLNKS